MFRFGFALAALALGLVLVLFRNLPTAEHSRASQESSGALAFVAPSAKPPRPRPQGVAVTEGSRSDPSDGELIRQLAAIQRQPDLMERERLLAALVQDLAQTNLTGTLQPLWHTNVSELEAELRVRLVRAWGETNAVAAAEWLSRQSPGLPRGEAIGTLATTWANHDHQAAVSWANTLPGEERQSAIKYIAYEVARSEPLEALRLAVSLESSDDRDGLISQTLRGWAATDAATAAEWVLQIEDPGLRDHSLADVAGAWAETSPADAASWALEALPAGEVQNHVVSGIVQTWMQSDPQAASAWVQSFPEGTLRDQAVDNVVKLWADHNLEQTEQWLRDLAPGEIRDTAVRALVNKTMHSAPATAAQWVESIPDAALRLRQTLALAGAWLEIDAEAARAWIRKSSIPAPQKASLLSANSPRQP